MDVNQFREIKRNIVKQLELRNYKSDTPLKFDLCQTKDYQLNKTQVYVNVNSENDIVRLLNYFKISDEISEADITQLIKDKKLHTSDGILLILEI